MWHDLELAKEFTFDSAHRLPHVPEGHKCGRLHGHTWRVELRVRGRLKTDGMVLDYADIKDAWRPLDAALDHRYLNEIEGLENPTSEHLAIWIWERLAPQFPTLTVVVRETCTTSCTYSGPRRLRDTSWAGERAG